MELSKEAETDLLAAPHAGQGAKVPARTVDVEWELINQGLVGPGGGLTRKGTIVRERILAKRIEDAF